MSSPVECHRGAPDPNPEPSRSEAQQARTPSRWASQADSPFGFPRVATRSQVMVSTSMTDAPLAAGEAFMSPLGLSFRPSRSATCSSRLQARAQESAPRMCLQKSAGARGRTRVNEAGAGEARRSGLPRRPGFALQFSSTFTPPCGLAPSPHPAGSPDVEIANATTHDAITAAVPTPSEIALVTLCRSNPCMPPRTIVPTTAAMEVHAALTCRLSKIRTTPPDQLVPSRPTWGSRGGVLRPTKGARPLYVPDLML